MEQYIPKSALLAEIERNLYICAIMISQHQDDNCVELYKQKAEVYQWMRSFLDTIEVKELDLVCYIKVNAHNQIEEIGCDFERRFRQDLNAILKRDDVIRSTNLHTIMFTLIGDEYWLKLFRERKEK